MSPSENVIVTKEMRLRLIDMEYDELSEEEFIRQFKRIYIEEYGKELQAEIDVFHSSQSKSLESDVSGYDGTALYFKSKENGINEVYVISQGSQGEEDWLYNIKAMFAGLDYSQAEKTRDFVIDAKKEFKITEADNIPVIGLSHSLAHNNNATAHLAFNVFDKIYSVNGAQTNYYQLYLADDNFAEEVRKHFSISRINPNAIYDINPNKLREFAENHYKDKAQNIHQLISFDDPLYAVSGTRGFFTLGEVKHIDSNPKYGGLRPLIDKIPDHVIKDFQDVAIQFTVSSKRGGMDAVLKDLFAIDMSVVNKIDGLGSIISVYFTEQQEIAEMVQGINDKLPGIMKKIKTITNNSEVIFGELVKAGYITKGQKEELVTEFTNIEAKLVDIQETVEMLALIREDSSFSAQLGADVGTYLRVKDNIESLVDSLEVLKKDEYQNLVHMIGASHGIPEILKTFSDKHKSYLGTDMVLSTGGNKDIKVNISAALRMYYDGKIILEEKEAVIKNLDISVKGLIYHEYELEKKDVMNKINDMEQNPGSYRNLLRKHVYFPRLNKTVRNIDVHETFYPLNGKAKLDTEIAALHESVQLGYAHFEKYRKGIEDLFDKDEYVATLFDLARG